MAKLLSRQTAMTESIHKFLTKQNKIEANVTSITEHLNALEVQLSTIGASKTEVFTPKDIVVRLEKGASYLLGNS